MSPENQSWIYFGTSLDAPTEAMIAADIPASHGLYAGRWDAETGKIDAVHLVMKTKAIGFFAVDNERGILYLAGQTASETQGDMVYAFQIDRKTGELTLFNQQPIQGNGPCHLSLSPNRDFLTLANYPSGNFNVFRLQPDGRVGELTGDVKKAGHGPNVQRQDSPKGHASYFVEHQGVTRLLMCDLGTDRVYIQRLDRETGAIQDDPEIPFLPCPPGSGPRHLTWTTDRDDHLLVFTINELDSTISVFRLCFSPNESAKDASVLEQKSANETEEQALPHVDYLGSWSTLEAQYRKILTDRVHFGDGGKTYSNITAEIDLQQRNGHPNVYASNRGQNSIVAFDASTLVQQPDLPPVFPIPEAAADAPTIFTNTDFGKDLEKISGMKEIHREPTQGLFPRFFTFDPSGNFLIVANKRSGTIVVFRVLDDGTLSPTQNDPIRLAWCTVMGFAAVAP